jgi:hypothetical protein
MQKRTKYLQIGSIIMNGSTNQREFLFNSKNELKKEKAGSLKTKEVMLLSL